MPPPTTRDEIIELMRFMAVKSKSANGPMNIHRTCRQFKEETGTVGTVNSLQHRIMKHRDRIHEMDEFDMETRVRLMVALSGKVDFEFLIELRKHAYVEVDDQRRIVRYENKQRGSDESSTPPPAKRRKDSETDTSEEKPNFLIASWVTEDDEMFMSFGEGASDRGGHNTAVSDDEELPEYASFSAKRSMNSELDTSGGRKMARTASEVLEDNDEPNSVGEGTSHLEGINIHQENYEEAPEIDQKPVDLFHHTPNARDDEYHYERAEHASREPENLVENVPEESTSVRDLLILLRGTLVSLESTESTRLNGLRWRIKEKIEKLSNGRDREFPLETINFPFDMCMCLLMNHASPETGEESINLRSFLTCLRSATGHLVHPSMTPFHEKMKMYLEELELQNKKIPIKIVRSAIDAILNFIDP